MLDTYTGRDTETLQQLKIYPMKTLAFEEKLPEEVFEDYDSNVMEIKVNFWRSGLQALSENVLNPAKLKVKKDMPMQELCEKLADENKTLTGEDWKWTDVMVLKRNPLLNTSHLEIISDKPEKLLS